MNQPVTVADGLRFLAPQIADSDSPPAWPPDAFAIAAWLFEKSGAYTNVIARYATVLADDPGSSVLTLTSLGMAALSRPPKVPLRPRLIALWKDAKSGAPVEIDMPPGAAACVLSLAVQWDEEWTADGRGDGRTIGYVILAGYHPIFPAL